MILRQIAIVTALSLRSLRTRAWQSLVIVLGMACVIGVLLSMLSMTEGMRRAYLRSGDPRAVIVVSRGTEWEINSSIPRDHAAIVMTAPGIAKAADGSPIADSSVMVAVPAQLKKNDARAPILLRGFGKKGAMLQPGFHMLSGRMFRPGTRELIAGSRASEQFKGMAVGDKVILPNGDWPIVGTYATGDLLDGQLIGDTETLMPAIRHKAYTTVVAQLQSPDAFATFRSALTRNPALAVEVWRLPDWNNKISKDFTAFLHVFVYGVCVILAIGALFGCFNTMYAAVGSRAQEIATLRALGYSGFAVAVSVLLEAATLSISGALIGAFIAWGLYDGVPSGFGSDVFTLLVSPALFATAVLWAMAVAFLGGILPSLQAAGSTVSDALRAR
jgi:putative ABC transport system permease protein